MMQIKRSAVFIILSVVCATAHASEESIRLLSIGNSFADNALTYLSDIAKAAGKQVLVGKACLGGCDLERHMRHVDAYEADSSDPEGSPYAGGKKSLQQLLEEEPWDYVTIQQVSHKSFRPETYHPYVDRLIATIQKYAPQAEIVIHQTWAYRTDHGFFGEPGLNADSMYCRLCKAYDALSRETGFRQIPSGDAMEAARQDPEWGPFIPDPDFDPATAKYPELPQHDKRALNNGWYGWRQDKKTGKWVLSRDCIHANREGKYLLGCVWFEFFFDKSVVGNSFLPSGMSPDDAAILQRIAHRVAGGSFRQIIAEALAAGEKNITIPPGRYETRPQDGTHLLLENLSDIVIDAAGVELICTETTRAISIKYCTNLTIRGLTIDYDPLPFTQGRIIGISDDRRTHTIEIMDGFQPSETAIPFKYAIYDPDGFLRYGNYFDYTLKPLPRNRLQVQLREPDKDGGEHIGDTAVISSQHLVGEELPHAVTIENSTGCVFENVTVYSSPCFGFYEEHCDDSVYKNCTIDRRTGRLHSLNADAFHSKFAKRGPQIIGCKAMWQGDDCVNICGAYHLVTEADGAQLRVLAKTSMDIQAGDAVELVTEDGTRLPDATVRSVERAGKITGEERQNLKQLDLLPWVCDFLKDAYRIRLDRNVELPFGSVIGSINRKGNGFAVKDCTFGNNRSRGILIKASNGIISGNRIENAHMQAIKIAPEYEWLESGYSRNVDVVSNVVINSGMEALLIKPVEFGSGFKNIRIQDNRFESGFYPAVSIPDSGCSILSGNRVNGKRLGRRQ